MAEHRLGVFQNAWFARLIVDGRTPSAAGRIHWRAEDVDDCATYLIGDACGFARPGYAAGIAADAVAARRQGRIVLPGHTDIADSIEPPVTADAATGCVAVGSRATRQ